LGAGGYLSTPPVLRQLRERRRPTTDQVADHLARSQAKVHTIEDRRRESQPTTPRHGRSLAMGVAGSA
jgi:hypothetical protein